jgi:hypothetical protein
MKTKFLALLALVSLLGLSPANASPYVDIEVSGPGDPTTIFLCPTGATIPNSAKRARTTLITEVCWRMNR